MAQTSHKTIEQELLTLSPPVRRIIARVAGADENVQELAKVLFDLNEAVTESEDEENDADPVDPFDLPAATRGSCKYLFCKAGEAYNQSERVGKAKVELGGEEHFKALCQEVQGFVACNSVNKFMIGKASMKREKHLHAGMQNRFGEKYLPASYKRMLGLELIDGSTEDAQAIVWLLEARLHNEFKRHDSWDKTLAGSHSGGAVKKGTEANYYFVLYLALK